MAESCLTPYQCYANLQPLSPSYTFGCNERILDVEQLYNEVRNLLCVNVINFVSLVSTSTSPYFARHILPANVNLSDTTALWVTQLREF